jgi:hypothetical protein
VCCSRDSDFCPAAPVCKIENRGNRLLVGDDVGEFGVSSLLQLLDPLPHQYAKKRFQLRAVDDCFLEYFQPACTNSTNELWLSQITVQGR